MAIRGKMDAPMKGKGLGPKYEKAKQVGFRALKRDFDDVVDTMLGMGNKTSMRWLLSKHITKRLIALSAMVLKDAAQRCPWESGKLRESGRVSARVGKGRFLIAAKVVDGKVERPDVTIVRQYITRPTTKNIEVDIYFNREVDGKDLALWAHEELLRYVKRPKTASQMGKWYARHFGTGPKYLENAWKIHRAKYEAEIERGIQDAIREYNKRWGTKVRRRGK